MEFANGELLYNFRDMNSEVAHAPRRAIVAKNNWRLDIPQRKLPLVHGVILCGMVGCQWRLFVIRFGRGIAIQTT